MAGSPYPIIASAAVGSGLSNYDITFVNGELTVVGDSTSTSLATSAVSTLVGQAITFTATVASSGPITDDPTGLVTFYDGSSDLGSASLSTTGGITTASLTTTSLAMGSHSVTAVYVGDSDFSGSVCGLFDVSSTPILETGIGFLNSGAGGGAVAVDAQGNLFIADSGNNVIRELQTDGTLTTVAGNGSCCNFGDGGPAIEAALNDPDGLAVDVKHGDLFIADSGDNCNPRGVPERDHCHRCRERFVRLQR